MTLHVGDVVLVHNDHHMGRQKLKDCGGDDTYQVISHVEEAVPVYVIKNKAGRRQTLHRNRLFLIDRADTAEVMVKMFRTMSTMMLPGSPCQEANEGSQPTSELVTDVEAQDTSGWRFLGSMTNAVNCMSSAVGAVKATIARRWPHE